MQSNGMRKKILKLTLINLIQEHLLLQKKVGILLKLLRVNIKYLIKITFLGGYKVNIILVNLISLKQPMKK